MHSNLRVNEQNGSTVLKLYGVFHWEICGLMHALNFVSRPYDFGDEIVLFAGGSVTEPHFAIFIPRGDLTDLNIFPEFGDKSNK